MQQRSRAEQIIFEHVASGIKKALGRDVKSDLIEIGQPPQQILGDVSVPCFALAKQLKQDPATLARALASSIQAGEIIARAEAAGPYLNIFLKRPAITKAVLTEITKAKRSYGSSKLGKGKKVMVEYFSPNTNKPLTIGHVRNICLGASIVKLLRFTGHKVITATLYNDRGIAIAKTIAGYQKWGQGGTPRQAGQKPDHFVGSFYVRFAQEEKNDPNLPAEAKRILVAWEKDDPKVRKVWQQLMTWVLDGFRQTLDSLDVEPFDEAYYESEYYAEGKKLIVRGLDQGIFQQGDDGVVYAPLGKYGLPDKVLLRPDDTSLYITQDLYLAQLKSKHKLDASLYIVGSEQDLYFKQLFKILELLGLENKARYHHLSYGMIRLPAGKIKSREGLAAGTGADELLEQLIALASAEIKNRFPKISKRQLDKRARALALAALKFYILQVSPKTTMVFDSQKSLSFTGRTGPYLQYTYARIARIFEKANVRLPTRINYSLLTDKESFAVCMLLARFPGAISDAVRHYDPAELAAYLYDLSQAVSIFYEKVPVLAAADQEKKARLRLLQSVQAVLATGLTLLDIEPLEEM